MKSKLFLIVVVWFFSGSLTSMSAQAQPCGCADKKDMLNYLNIGKAAAQEYKLQMETFSVTPQAYSEEILTAVLEYVKNMESAVHLPGAGSSSLWLDDRDCTINEHAPSKTPPSLCLQAISRHFLEALQTICRGTKGPPGAGRPPNSGRTPYFEGMELKFLFGQFLAAYDSTERYILSMLNSLPKNCRPHGWFGYVFLYRVGTEVSVESIPPRPRSGPYGAFLGGTTSIDKKWKDVGTILVEDGKVVSIRASAALSENFASKGSEEIFCNTTDGWRTKSFTINFKSFLEGETKGDAVSASKFTLLKINPADRTYDIYVQVFPRVETTGKKFSSIKTTSPECRKSRDPADGSEPYTSSSSLVGYAVTKEKIKPGSPDYLEGGRVVKPAEFNKTFKVGNINTTLSQNLTVRWMLRRLPTK